MSGFFRVVNIDGYSIPVCVVLSWYHEESTITHEWTHFRNNVIGSDYYSSGGWRDMYESLVYDDLQEEILAFFSEGLKRSYVQMSILHDKRYQFYMRIEWWWEAEKRRFIQDVTKYINIAREVKELRWDTYIIDLALIPLHKWYRYLLYLKKSP